MLQISNSPFVGKNMDNESSIHDNLERILQDEGAEPCAIPLQYLKKITANFSGDRRLGNGGFGVVYKGELQNGKMVAVKKLRSIVQCDESQFRKELDNLMRVRHKNIVRFVGYCCETQKLYTKFKGNNVLAETTKMLLCFEYMPKGSLDMYISDEICGLEWYKRYKIIKGICYGLHYLHDKCQPDGSIVHLDLKPENVLLDGKFVPKIADFGLSRLFGHEKTQTSMTFFAGSLGYMSPELIYQRKVSPMSDIYSLGVIIVEMITGHKHGPSGTEEFCGDFVEPVLQNWRKRLETTPKDMSATLENMSLQTAYQQIETCLEIGINCIQYDRRKRPAIGQIIKMLDKLEGTHSSVSDERRPDANQVVHGYRERISGEDSTFRNTSTPPSPMHPKLFQENHSSRTEGNGSVSFHPLPLPLGAISPMQTAFSDQPTPKVEMPSVAGQWQKGILIGTGTFACVYAATNRHTGALCAMKEFDMIPDDAKSAEYLKDLEQEIKFLSQFKHENIVQYYGSEIIEDRFNIYLEYVHPGSMNMYVRHHCQGTMAESVIRNFTRHILRGLAFLHGQKIMHRDIRGANLLVDVHGVVKLSDFGTAKHLGTVPELSVKGSSYWMAPEMVQTALTKDIGYDLAVDIWSLGCTIIEMFDGKPPWSDFEGVAVLFKVLHEDPPIPENLSHEGKEFLQCCFKRNPAERPTASELLDHPFIRNSSHYNKHGSIYSFAGIKVNDNGHSSRDKPTILEE